MASWSRIHVRARARAQANATVSHDSRARAVSRPSGRSRRRTQARARQLVEQKREGGRGESLVVGEGVKGPREVRTTWRRRSGRISSLFGRTNCDWFWQMSPTGTSGTAIARRLGMGQVCPDAKTSLSVGFPHGHGSSDHVKTGLGEGIGDGGHCHFLLSQRLWPERCRQWEMREFFRTTN